MPRFSTIVRATASSELPDSTEIFNNAAQHWNHSFFWKCLAPGGGGEPAGALAAQIQRDFDSHSAFCEQFEQEAASHFGSGWLWLVSNAGKLELLTTHDADTPIAHDKTALLCCDLWEHAYYVDYENRRPEYISRFLANLVNWRFAEGEFASMKSDA